MLSYWYAFQALNHAQQLIRRIAIIIMIAIAEVPEYIRQVEILLAVAGRRDSGNLLLATVS